MANELSKRVEIAPDFLHIIMIEDETWVFQYDLEKKRKSTEYTPRRKPNVKTSLLVVSFSTIRRLPTGNLYVQDGPALLPTTLMFRKIDGKEALACEWRSLLPWNFIITMLLGTLLSVGELLANQNLPTLRQASDNPDLALAVFF